MGLRIDAESVFVSVGGARSYSIDRRRVLRSTATAGGLARVDVTFADGSDTAIPAYAFVSGTWCHERAQSGGAIMVI